METHSLKFRVYGVHRGVGSIPSGAQDLVLVPCSIVILESMEGNIHRAGD